MKITTKYNLGDKVWCLMEDGCRRPRYPSGPHVIQHVEAETAYDGGIEITYSGSRKWKNGHGIEYTTYEDHLPEVDCFKTKRGATTSAKRAWNVHCEEQKI